MRIQKYLAQVSQHSRRAVEKLVIDKQIKLNGKTVALGTSVRSGDRIDCEGKVYQVRLHTHNVKLISYHKPKDIICTKQDPENRTTVFDQLPKCPEGRWIAVGRLDINSEGLLLLSNNGDLANKMMHPSTNWQRVYHVRVYGEVDEVKIQQLCKGVQLDGVWCKFSECVRISQHTQSKNAWFKVSVYTGRYRMVRRMWEQVGLRVSRLVRVAYGPFALDANSKPGAIVWLPTNTPTIEKLL